MNPIARSKSINPHAPKKLQIKFRSANHSRMTPQPMPILSRCSLLMWLMLLLAGPCPADDREVYLDVEIGESYTLNDNYLDRTAGGFTRDASFNLLRVTPSMAWSPLEGLDLFASADVYWQNPIANEDDDPLEADLTAAYIELSNSSARLAAGGIPIQFGGGLIMADETMAAILNVNGAKTYLEIKAAQVEETSPMVGAAVGYRPGRFERIELFGVWFSDHDDIFAGSLPLRIQSMTNATSEGNLYWIGASAELFAGPALFSLVGAYQTGRFTIDGTIPSGGMLPTRRSYSFKQDVEAYFVDLSLEGNVTEWASLGAFCYVASGDAERSDGRLNAAIGVNAGNSRMAIFFDPDFLDRDDEDRFTFSGVTSGGVIAPGIGLTLQPVDRLSVKVAVAAFFAQEALPSGEQWYGYEIDVGATVKLFKQHALFFEAARFEHGDYCEAWLGQSDTPDPAIRLVVGARLVF